MPQPIIYILLLLALILPVPGAIALRLVRSRLSETQFLGSIAALFGVAIISVVLLSQSNVSSLQAGNLTLLLPVIGAESHIEAEEVLPPPTRTGEDKNPTTTPTTRPTTPAITTTTTLSPTMEVVTPTETLSPTLDVVTPTETPEPAPPPPEEPAVAPPETNERRTYTVQDGDTLRSIAEQSGVEVTALLEANNMTPEDGDSLQPGQELVIP